MRALVLEGESGQHTTAAAKPLWKSFGSLLYKVKIYLPYDPVSLFLGIFLREMKANVHKNACTRIFIAASNWRQPFCVATGR